MLEYYKNVAEKTIDVNEDLNTRLTKAAAYRAEYEELMNTKRLRGLTATETKWAQTLKNNIEYYDSLRDQEFENLKTRLNLQEISEEEYYAQLTVLRDTYFKEGSSEWAKYTIEISQYNLKSIEEQKKNLINIFDEINAKYDESINALLKKQENAYNKFVGISDIYNKISINGAKKGETYNWLQLSNIDQELYELKNYSEAITRLKEKTDSIFDNMDLDKNTSDKMKALFLDQIAKLNVTEATGFSNYLLNINESRLSDYLGKWVEKINLSDFMSKNLYSDQANNLIKSYTQEMSDTFTAELNEKFSSIPDSFFESGSLSAEQFKNGFVNAIDEVMIDLSNEITRKINSLLPDVSLGQNSKNIVNNSNYNIYGAVQPAQTALELYKQEAKRRMLVGDN